MAVFIFKQARTLLPMVAMATGEVRAYHLGAIVNSSIGVALMLYLAARVGWGALGVALALLVSVAVSDLIYFWPLQLRLTGVRFREFVAAVLVRGMLPAAIASIVWACLGLFVQPSSWLSLAAVSVVGAAVYVLALGGLCLDEKERGLAQQSIQRLLPSRTRS
jgi:hypothetical protein